MTRVDLSGRTAQLRSRRTPYVLATVVRVERPTSAKPGDAALVLPDGSMEGFVGGTCAESTVRMQGLRLLQTGESTLLRITPGADDPETSVEGLVTVANPCLSGGTLEIFLEAAIPPTLVHVFGEAPVARALERLVGAIGYDVTATADPELPLAGDTNALVVASHGRDEERILSDGLAAGVPYVALVASRRRGEAVLAALPVAEADRKRVHTPAGLDIGARTAPEVALSILAEIVAGRRSDEVRTSPSREIGVPDETEAVDPVCGMTVAVTSASPAHRHVGSTWFFCGPGCRQAFIDDPERYVRDGTG